MEVKNITITKKLTTDDVVKRIKAEYPKGVDLVYIDYSDSFDSNDKAMEQVAQTGFIDDFEMDWINDNQWETIKELKKQLFNEEEQRQIEEDEDLRCAVNDTFYEIDTSDPIKDLMKHTHRRYYYYDLDLEIEDSTYNDGFWDHQKEKWDTVNAKRIAKKLRISYKKHKKDLLSLVNNAGYGGRLTILFVADPMDFYGEIKAKYIKFKDNYEICIMDRGNGSGNNETLNIKELIFEFKRENLHDDEGDTGYSYSGDVCGLSKGDTATFQFTNNIKKSDKIIKIQTNEEAEAYRKQEAIYEKIFKEGKCSLGDMKQSRHREIEYINDFPCGQKCKICGNFWID